MKQADIYQYLGSMQQLAYIKQACFQEGESAGKGVFLVKNGPLQFQVMRDKCLDLSELSYKGMNMGMHIGFLYTGGLKPETGSGLFDDSSYFMDGSIRNVPAGQCSSKAEWKDGDYVLSVSGEMRKEELFGSRLSLRRKITTAFGKKEILISDTVTNESGEDAPFYLLYHFNLGFPLVNEHALLFLPAQETAPADKDADKDAEQWFQMEKPVQGEPLRIYEHTLGVDEDGGTFAGLVNTQSKRGIQVFFNGKQLPHFYQWKSLAAGSYGMGFGPGNTGLSQKDGEALCVLKPFASQEIEIGIRILDGQNDIEGVYEQVDELMEVE